MARERHEGEPVSGLVRGREHREPSPVHRGQALDERGAGDQISAILPESLVRLSPDDPEERGTTPPAENAPRRRRQETPPVEPDPEPADVSTDERGNNEQPQPDEETEDESGAFPWQYLSDFADAAELPMDSLLSMKHRIKSAGKDVEVTLSDVISGYQKGDDYQQKTQAIAELRRQHETNERARHEAFIQASQGISEQLSMFETYLQAQMYGPEMQQLRATDPSEYLERKEAIETAWNDVQNRRQQHRTEFEKQQDGFRQEHLRRERDTLQSLRPDWTQSRGQVVHDLLMNMGVSQEEYKAIDESARLMVLMDELATLRAEKAASSVKRESAKTIAERIKKGRVPRTATPGNTPNPNRVRAAGDARKVKQLRENLRNKGTLRAAADLISATVKIQ